MPNIDEPITYESKKINMICIVLLSFFFYPLFAGLIYLRKYKFAIIGTITFVLLIVLSGIFKSMLLIAIGIFGTAAVSIMSSIILATEYNKKVEKIQKEYAEKQYLEKTNQEEKKSKQSDIKMNKIASEDEKREREQESKNTVSTNKSKRIYAGKEEILGDKARKILTDNCNQDEKVLFCLNGIDKTQVVVALDKRLLTIKIGFMAGATFGQRVTSFYYENITGIEVNTGLAAGVLEICTPSNQGNSTKDYWGSGDNSPWKVSNCIPIDKGALPQYKPYIEKLHEIINKAKNKNQDVQTNDSDITNKISKLNELYKSKVLTKVEFEKAKKKLLD